MKATIDGKRYDTDRCETLGEYSHYNNGNYSGTTYLLQAANGQLLVHTSSNGQDLWLNDELRAWEPDGPECDTLDHYRLTAEQETRLVELGLLEII